MGIKIDNKSSLLATEMYSYENQQEFQGKERIRNSVIRNKLKVRDNILHYIQTTVRMVRPCSADAGRKTSKMCMGMET